MKSSLASNFVFVLFIAISGLGQAQSASKLDLLVSVDSFSPNSVVTQGESAFIGPNSKIESGELNGIAYRFYYSDGSGSFVGRREGALTGSSPFGASNAAKENWSVGCHKDAISDKKTCHMLILGRLSVVARPKGSYSVRIGFDHFPGSTITIRIDDGKPITDSASNDGQFPPQISAKLVSQLKKASKVTTRYMQWPYRYWVDETWELYGFNEALQYVTWAVEKIR